MTLKTSPKKTRLAQITRTRGRKKNIQNGRAPGFRKHLKLEYDHCRI